MTTMSFHTVLNFPAFLNRTWCSGRSNPSAAVQLSSVFIQTDESGNTPESKKILGPVAAVARCQAPNSLLTQANTVGILGGVSVFSTLIFLEKLVWWSSRHGEESLPFVVCSDPTLNRELASPSLSPFFRGKNAQFQLDHGPIVENLRCKRAFLEQSGARCIVMPCHLAHAWHSEVSKGCPLPFLHVGECVASELKKAKFKPLEAGSNVRIGVLAPGETLMAGFYQEKLQSQGFEVVLPDMATMEHIVVPAIEALHRKDMEGARNLLRIAVHIFLMRAVNIVILASDEMQDLLPRDDPLSKKCINPMDALARSTIGWAKSIEEVHRKA
ncbi:hypothetical protein VitviT2T_016629 [Vitis vinifera]|uniref:Aspartate racemase n=3 Tax=Vitis vinifera TaxID=29760 RepID=A0A438JPV2_VITVI|nr:uncharacterized protein LOC100853647 [Vitis vinifera]RVW47492.1 Aspartate racemase [Vitis vinifera]RVX10991.1 Aspartate racemase [Vitis vinifera]WJZ98075.1 hypothetical protein VitviT2T_016629 [Vitis vinifera]|eukprot:XP_003633103.2 PREDICTED: uncharacterized protein LOC100853647 [Vitis vinifera]